MINRKNGWRSGLARWLASGWEEEPYRPPQKRTWVEKVTDEHNAWLAARRLELEGNLRNAARAYSADAAVWKQRGHLARAAISVACEARCLQQIGLDGVEGYERAGELFAEGARRALREDPLRALQLYARASECLALSGNRSKADEVGALLDSIRSALNIAAGR